MVPATTVVVAAGGVWFLLLLRRKRTEQRFVWAGHPWSALGGGIGLALFLFGLTGLDRVPLPAGAAMFCAAAALTAFVARLILREVVPRAAWAATVLLIAAAALVGLPGWPLALSGIGWGMHALLARRGEALDAWGRHLIVATVLAVPVLVRQPPLRGEALVLSLAAAACLVILAATWGRVRVPALGIVALLTGLCGVVWGQPPGLALVLAAGGAVALQRMIGSSGS